ncbi:protein of unknown function [Desulfovibrio sp. 86]|nr:protein of unknown function [Desulfovibrio sp. 86]
MPPQFPEADASARREALTLSAG